ncbi:MAG: MFS transporter [Pseudomonadota bacterium]
MTQLLRRPLVIILAGCLISTVGFGARSTFGLFLEPMTAARGWGRETFAMALALQNLCWGLVLPFASALADRYGPSRVLTVGAVVYGAGVWGMAMTSSALGFNLLAGVLTGTGIALTSFSIALAAMVQVVPTHRQTLVLGLGTAAGSAGQVLFSPLSQALIGAHGWSSALVILASLVLVVVPAAWLLPPADTPEASASRQALTQTLGQAVREALKHRGYLLLTVGFFVCGFHVAFITVHFPAYVKDLGLPAQVGAYAIALIGLFNIAGSILSGLAGQRWPMRHGLAVIYALRAVAITALLLLPKTSLSMLVFASAMGLLWLSTVPLTSGIVARVFGPRYMATLFGIVFLSHQLGSFSGVWLGGYLYDKIGAYDLVWWTGVGLSLLATLIHLPIDERPLRREPLLARAEAPHA